MVRHPLTKKFLQSGLFKGLRSFGQLERRIEKLEADSIGATNLLRGNAFEVFAAAYLATQRSQMVKRIWPKMQLVPPTIARRLGWHSTDHGADGLVETESGDLRAYQVKFRSGRASLPWAEVSTFFGVTDRSDDRLLFTNSTSVAEITEKRRDFISIRGNDLDQLEAADFQAMLEWMRGAKLRHKKHTPRPHQRKALSDILKAFKKEDRGTVISACGTGKTFLALWAAEALGRRSVIVLVPSLALIRQTLRDWSKNTNWKSFDYICVCSDPTVSQEEDSLVVRPTELPFSVTTEPAKVRKFLRHPFKGVKVVFTTYQSAPIVGRAMARGEAFDLGIFDEAHKTAGSEGKRNAFALSDKNLRIRKRLFLTATPRKYRVPSKESERGKDLEPVYSMDQPEIYGRPIHKLSFGKAAAQGIICNYKVIISVVTSSAAEQQQRRRGIVMVKGDAVKAGQVVNQLAIAQAVRKHKIGKVFSFHLTKKSAASFVSESSEGVRSHLRDFHTSTITGEMPTSLREAKLQEFQDAKRGIVSNVRCLTEGVDVPAVDMVAFMSPKRSKVDIVQAVGRAMRNSPGKKFGYILVPLHVELKKNESLEDAVKRAGFDEVWQVLAAMQEQDEILDDAIHQIQADRKLGKGFNDELFRRMVEIVGPPVALSALRNSVATKCLERLSRPWDEYVRMLLAFKKQFHHLRVPADARAPWKELSQWIRKIRTWKRYGILSGHRIALLDKLGFEWLYDGETLESTSGLLNEKQFQRVSGFSRVRRYREAKLIEPIGYALTPGGISAFYNHRQIAVLKKRLGITLNTTRGLLTEHALRAAAGLTKLARYRQKGLIKPFGYAMTNSGVRAFYHPKQIERLKKKIGITLSSTKGLLNEKHFAKKCGFWSIAPYRRQKLIEPVGYALTKAGVSPFYHPKQIKDLRNALGITLDSTRGLLNESQFRQASGFSQIEKYRKSGVIKPIGYAGTGHGVGPFYHRRQIWELKRKLGITLETTTGLLSEKRVKKLPGLRGIANYRERGLIKPFGIGVGGDRFYKPEQLSALRKKLGVTLDSTKGLLTETQFIRLTGLTQIARYRKQGLIKPRGYAVVSAGLGAHYHPRQISELKKALGITLNSTKGLLNQMQMIKASGLTALAKYREKGLIKPVGYAMSGAGIGPYYHPRQIEELRKTLGITLASTRGLLIETDVKQLPGLSKIRNYRGKGLIRPAGFAMSKAGLSAYYRPSDVLKLRQIVSGKVA
jgi:superfamily II DNA or RNA helicase/DNA-binding transcriptional MerR regulator